MSTLLEVKDLVKSYHAPSRSVLVSDHISFSIKEAEMTALTGPSGSGKSALAKMIVKIEQADSGHLFWQGKNYTHYTEKQMIPVRRQMVLLLQQSQSSFHPYRRLDELIMEPALLQNPHNKVMIREHLTELLDICELGPSVLVRYAHQISGGEADRLNLIRALLLKPRLLIFDEVGRSLDLSLQLKYLSFLKKINERDKTAYLYISHDFNHMRFLTENIFMLDKGLLK